MAMIIVCLRRVECWAAAAPAAAAEDGHRRPARHHRPLPLSRRQQPLHLQFLLPLPLPFRSGHSPSSTGPAASLRPAAAAAPDAQLRSPFIQLGSLWMQCGRSQFQASPRPIRRSSSRRATHSRPRPTPISNLRASLSRIHTWASFESP